MRDVNDIQTKEQALDEAVEWQLNFAKSNYSDDELVDYQTYFKTLGDKFGLTDYFIENGVIKKQYII